MEEARPGYVLECRGLRKTREDGERRFVFEAPDMRIPAAAKLALIGKNGTGKSTLLGLLALAIKPDAATTFRMRTVDGAREFDAWAAWKQDRRRKLATARRRYISYLPQSLGLLEFLTTKGNLEQSARLAGVNVRAAVREVVDALDLQPLLSAYPISLSGGQRQRVAAGCALVRRPSIVLADEPTAAMDEDNAANLISSLCEMTTSLGSALIIATHDRDLVRNAGFRALYATSEPDGSGGIYATLRPGK